MDAVIKETPRPLCIPRSPPDKNTPEHCMANIAQRLSALSCDETDNSRANTPRRRAGGVPSGGSSHRFIPAHCLELRLSIPEPSSTTGSTGRRRGTLQHCHTVLVLRAGLDAGKIRSTGMA